MVPSLFPPRARKFQKKTASFFHFPIIQEQHKAAMLSTIKTLSLIATFASCLSWRSEAFQEQAGGNVSINVINITDANSVESFLQTDWLEAQARNGVFSNNPKKVIDILERSQCGIVYLTGGYGSGSITAKFLGPGDSTKENFHGGGWGATTESLSSRDWSAIEFDVSADICIYEMYIGCGSSAHKSGSARYQKWTADKINKEGVDKAGKSWWKGDRCYHIGWFKVREDYMDWA